ncbi:hypothetical protein GQ457_03G020000 [Hibiscus cannabinus]
MKLQNHDATLKSMETQVGQISQILNTRPIGGFPSDTEVAKGATHEQCKAITTRSGKILMQSNNQRGTTGNPSAAIDAPAEVGEPAKTREDHYNPHNTNKGESSTESSHTKPDKSEDIRPPPPFPQWLKKKKQDYQFKKFFDILKQVHINLPLVEALQQMPNYVKFLKDMNKVPAKKTDPGSFTIKRFIGNNYPTKALCDPGASKTLMPKSVFRKLGIREAKPTTVMLQLADQSYVQPEGKIEDILIQVDKFIFPADFLILDCEADDDAPIILGRPFLDTGRVLFDFGNEEKIDRNTSAAQRGIRLEENHKPTVDAQRRLNQAMKHVVTKEILKWLDASIIYPISASEWVSPVQCIPKKGGINVISNEKNELIPTRIIIFPYPLLIKFLTDWQENNSITFLMAIQVTTRLHLHLKINPKPRSPTHTEPSLFSRMPFGLCNAPATFQRCMTSIFSDLNEDCLEIFMDDFSTFGKDFDNCLSNLEKVLIRCKETNLVLNWENATSWLMKELYLVTRSPQKGWK